MTKKELTSITVVVVIIEAIIKDHPVISYG